MPHSPHNPSSELAPEPKIDAMILSLEQRLRESAAELEKLRNQNSLDIRNVY